MVRSAGAMSRSTTLPVTGTKAVAALLEDVAKNGAGSAARGWGVSVLPVVERCHVPARALRPRHSGAPLALPSSQRSACLLVLRRMQNYNAHGRSLLLP